MKGLCKYRTKPCSNYCDLYKSVCCDYKYPEMEDCEDFEEQEK